MLGQEQHQAIIQEHIEALSGRVEFNTTLLGLEQDEDGVTAEISTAKDDQVTTEKARFAYVVGADGARSTSQPFFPLPKPDHSLQVLSESLKALILLERLVI